MSTVTIPPRSQTAPASPEAPANVSGDQRIVIQGVGWHVYDCLSEAIGEGQHVRLAYDGEDLEIMTTGYPHERYKELLGKIVAAVTLAPRHRPGHMRGDHLETTGNRQGTPGRSLLLL